MEIKGCRFTWMSNPRNGFITKERIDRLLVNWEWRQIYPNAIMTATPPISSYHSPPILTCKPKVGDGGLFKYEMYLEDHEDCHRVIDEGWNVEQFDEDPWGNLLSRFQSCKRTLTKWDKEQFKNAARELSKLKRRLAQLLNTIDFEVNYVEVNELKEKIKKLWDHEEKYWGQRSRLKWIKWGDRNTKFFHASTIQRRDRNRIQRLKNSNGEWVEGQEEVTRVILEHFQEVYNSTPIQGIEDCVAGLPKLVTVEMNAELSKPVSDAEIRNAVFSLGALKAPGGDGLNGSFYQKHWEVVGRQVCAAVTEFFQNGILPTEVNETQVVLVPKIQRPESVS